MSDTLTVKAPVVESQVKSKSGSELQGGMPGVAKASSGRINMRTEKPLPGLTTGKTDAEKDTQEVADATKEHEELVKDIKPGASSGTVEQTLNQGTSLWGKFTSWSKEKLLLLKRWVLKELNTSDGESITASFIWERVLNVARANGIGSAIEFIETIRGLVKGGKCSFLTTIKTLGYGIMEGA